MVLLCKKTASFLEFPLCFCPEPVLVERSFLSKGRRGMYHNHKSGQKHRFLTSHTTVAALLLVPSDGCTRKVGTSWCGFMSTYLRMDHGHDACQSARAGWPVLRVAAHGGLGEGGTAGRQDSRQHPSLTETAERTESLQCRLALRSVDHPKDLARAKQLRAWAQASGREHEGVRQVQLAQRPQDLLGVAAAGSTPHCQRRRPRCRHRDRGQQREASLLARRVLSAGDFADDMRPGRSTTSSASSSASVSSAAPRSYAQPRSIRSSNF